MGLLLYSGNRKNYPLGCLLGLGLTTKEATEISRNGCWRESGTYRERGRWCVSGVVLRPSAVAKAVVHSTNQALLSFLESQRACSLKFKWRSGSELWSVKDTDLSPLRIPLQGRASPASESAQSTVSSVQLYFGAFLLQRTNLPQSTPFPGGHVQWLIVGWV